MNSSLKATHLRYNQDTADSWSSYQPHRAKVMELLQGLPCPREILCVLGAGNCNDLELPLLTELFEEVHLVDIDDEALEKAQQRQDASWCDLHGNVDITGVFDILTTLSPTASTEEIQECLQQAQLYRCSAIPSESSMIVSSCMLTQMMQSVIEAIGEKHPLFLDIVLTLRNLHFRQILNHLAPHGVGVIITDVVSNTSLPRMLELSEKAFLISFKKALQQQNFFHGTHPGMIHQALHRMPQVEKVFFHKPWRWQMGSRSFAVCALSFIKEKHEDR